ncbi:MAG: hydrolase [Victivallaceae bacterium]|nr:hydrolase [Victivallaceae bacterium]
MVVMPKINSSALVVVDIQERLITAMAGMDICLKKSQIMLNAANSLGLDTIVTEQYPRGLGNTVPELQELFASEWAIIEKTTFSCCGETQFMIELERKKRLSIVIMGIETHVCVQQTVLDALAEGYQVFVLSDAVTSRSTEDRQVAIELMRDAGAVITTVESYLFMLMRDAKHPAFKTVSKLIR